MLFLNPHLCFPALRCRDVSVCLFRHRASWTADNPWCFDDQGQPQSYRMFVIQTIPRLVKLDGELVTDAEHDAADRQLARLSPEDREQTMEGGKWQYVSQIAEREGVFDLLIESRRTEAEKRSV
jgi:hypothetical protein